MAELHVQRKRGGLGWLWALLILIVIAAAVYLYLHNKNPRGYPLPNKTTGLVKQKALSATIIFQE